MSISKVIVHNDSQMASWSSNGDFDGTRQLKTDPDKIQPIYVVMPDAGSARVLLKDRKEFDLGIDTPSLNGIHVGHVATSQYCSVRETQPHQAGYQSGLDQLMRLSAYYARNCSAFDSWVTRYGYYDRPHIVIVYTDRIDNGIRVPGVGRAQVIFEKSPKALLSLDDIQRIYERSSFFRERSQRS